MPHLKQWVIYYTFDGKRYMVEYSGELADWLRGYPYCDVDSFCAKRGFGHSVIDENIDDITR